MFQNLYISPYIFPNFVNESISFFKLVSINFQILQINSSNFFKISLLVELFYIFIFVRIHYLFSHIKHKVWQFIRKAAGPKTNQKDNKTQKAKRENNVPFYELFLNIIIIISIAPLKKLLLNYPLSKNSNFCGKYYLNIDTVLVNNREKISTLSPSTKKKFP